MSHYLFGALGSKDGVPAGSLLLSVLNFEKPWVPFVGSKE